MYNYSELIGRIIAVFGKQSEFARAMNLSERSVSLKLNNKREWRQSEIKKACTLLKIPITNIHVYFFSLNVQY